MPQTRDHASPWPARAGDLTLREAMPRDVEQLLTFRNDPQVNRFMMRTYADPDVFRAEWAAVPDSATNYSCIAERAGDVVAMGFLEFWDTGSHPRTPRGVEGLIGYIVDPRHAGQGVASAMTPGLLAAGFEQLGMRRISAYCNRDNPASARVLEKAGMRREEHGVEDSWHAELGWVDGYGYAMLANEWRGAHRAGAAGGVERGGDRGGEREVRDSSQPVPPRPGLPREVAWAGDHARSERLEFAAATPADVEAMLAYRNLPGVGYWLLDEHIDPERFRRQWLKPGPDDASFVARRDGQVVGSVSLTIRDGSGQPGGPVARCQAEIGYILNPVFTGQGYGREMVAAVLDHCFSPLGLRRVTAGLYAGNLASARLASGLGMRVEQYGVLDSWHDDLGWCDGVTYGLLAREWRAR